MKKITALLLILISLLSLVSCGDAYEPVKSTDDEKRVVMSFTYEDKQYDVKYELYRALFVAVKDEIDGGNASVWSGDDKDKYIAEAHALIKDKAGEIYSILHVANKIGIDVYSKEYDKTVKEIIKLSIEGGYYGDTAVEGFNGDYEKYLSHLKGDGVNYSVQDLLIRYYIASTEVYLYYAGNLDTEDHLEEIVTGKLQYTEEDVYAFYNSTDCVRVIRAFLPKKYYTAERAAEIRLDILEKSNKGEDEVANYIIGTSTTGATDIKNGEIIAPHNLDRYYSSLTEAAFALPTFGVSEVIEVDGGSESGYVIIYKTVKSDLHFNSCYNQIRGVYLQNEVGKIIDTATDSIANGLSGTEILPTIDHALIISELG